MSEVDTKVWMRGRSASRTASHARSTSAGLARELVGDLELLGGVQRDARRLLTVAQRRVEDQYLLGVWHGVQLPLLVGPTALSWSCRGIAAAGALFPPRGEEGGALEAGTRPVGEVRGRVGRRGARATRESSGGASDVSEGRG